MEVNTQNVFVFILCFLIHIGIVNGQADQLANFANSLGSMLSGFEGGIGTDCKHTCPKGQKPQPKKNHKPSFNGCGSYGIELEIDHMPDETIKCCNTHDICYDTCNTEKDDCDKAFSKCLSDACHRLKTKTATKNCLETVDVMLAGTSMFGCKAYLDSQKTACKCIKNKKNTKTNDKDERKKKDAPSLVLPDLGKIFDDEL